jgi:hypothetical protein
MKIKLLFIHDGKINRKLNQVKLIKDLFGIGLKEAKDAVDSGEFIPQCDRYVSKRIIDFYQLYSSIFIN